METDLTLEEMLRRIVDHIGGELAYRAASIGDVEVCDLSTELGIMAQMGDAYASYAATMADLADDPTRVECMLNALASIEPQHGAEVLRVGSMTPQEGYAAFQEWKRLCAAGIKAIRSIVIADEEVPANILDIIASAARECEVCGRKAQPMGTEPRCAEHDSEGCAA